MPFFSPWVNTVGFHISIVASLARSSWTFRFYQPPSPTGMEIWGPGHPPLAFLSVWQHLQDCLIKSPRGAPHAAILFWCVLTLICAKHMKS
jgi:hypothetical protein